MSFNDYGKLCVCVSVYLCVRVSTYNLKIFSLRDLSFFQTSDPGLRIFYKYTNT